MPRPEPAALPGPDRAFCRSRACPTARAAWWAPTPRPCATSATLACPPGTATRRRRSRGCRSVTTDRIRGTLAVPPWCSGRLRGADRGLSRKASARTPSRSRQSCRFGAGRSLTGRAAAIAQIIQLHGTPPFGVQCHRPDARAWPYRWPSRGPWSGLPLACLWRSVGGERGPVPRARNGVGPHVPLTLSFLSKGGGR